MSPSVEEMKLVEKIVDRLITEGCGKNKHVRLFITAWQPRVLRIRLTNIILNAALEYSREVVTDTQAT